MSYLRGTERTSTNNEFKPLIDGQIAFQALLDALNNAKKFIYIATWYLDPDLELTRTSESNSKIGDILVERAKSKVDVKVLVFNHFGVVAYPIGYLGEYFRPDLRDYQKVLKSSGGDLRLTTNDFQPKNRLLATGSHHQKFCVMDENGGDPIGFLGGLNLGQHDWDTAQHIAFDERRKQEKIIEEGLKLQSKLELINMLLPYLIPYSPELRKEVLAGAISIAKYEINKVLDERYYLDTILESIPGQPKGLRKYVVDHILLYLLSREPCPPRHDIFCFLKGPAVGELLQEFQWRWGKETHQHLEIQNTPASTKTGQTRIEIAHTAPGGRKDILKAYLVAIAQAKRYIYLENQYFVSRTITSAISERLCQRPDLKVIIVLPDKAEDFIVGPAIARIQYRAFAWMKKVAKNVNRSEDRVHIFALKRWNPKANENIGFLKRAGVYWLAKAGIDISQSYLNWMLQKQEYTSIYVHAKIGIIDDQWMTIGSANISPRSFELDTELNVFLDDAEQATNFRTALWGEHLEKEECEVEDIDKTIALMVSTATANSQKESGDLDGRLVLLESAPPPMNYLLGFLYKSLAEEFL